MGIRKQRKFLADCALDTTIGPHRIIRDADNEEYFKLRAIELIKQNNVELAIGVLGFVLEKREEDTPT